MGGGSWASSLWTLLPLGARIAVSGESIPVKYQGRLLGRKDVERGVRHGHKDDLTFPPIAVVFSLLEDRTGFKLVPAPHPLQFLFQTMPVQVGYCVLNRLREILIPTYCMTYLASVPAIEKWQTYYRGSECGHHVFVQVSQQFLFGTSSWESLTGGTIRGIQFR